MTLEPVQGLDVVTKGSYIGAPVIDLEAALSATPTAPGITTGSARFEEVARWLEAAVGIPCTLTVIGDAPVRDVFVGTSTMDRGVLTRILRLQLVRARVAISRTVELGTPRPQARGARPAARSGFAKQVDEGPAPTRDNRSKLVVVGDTVVAFVGGG